MQQSIFDELYPKYKITKPIRLIEMFSGYGSQALALKYLDVKFEHWKICEWAIKSIQAYKDVHMTHDNIDYSCGYSKEALIDWLYDKGISSNYNEPMTKEQISRLNENSLRTIFNNIIATNNLVNIQQVKAKDLEIVDTNKYDYIFCYSFPCQDLSVAGKRAGMSDANTIMARDYKGFGNQEMNAVIEQKPKKIGSLYENSQAGSIYSEDAMCPTLTTESSANWNILLGLKNLRIRKLTPRECGRLMGLKDEDITNILSNQSDSSGYHLFGDSIVCQCLMYIFKNLIGDE